MNKKKRALALGLAATQLTSLTAIVAPLTAVTAVAADATYETDYTVTATYDNNGTPSELDVTDDSGKAKISLADADGNLITGFAADTDITVTVTPKSTISGKKITVSVGSNPQELDDQNKFVYKLVSADITNKYLLVSVVAKTELTATANVVDDFTPVTLSVPKPDDTISGTACDETNSGVQAEIKNAALAAVKALGTGLDSAVEVKDATMQHYYVTGNKNDGYSVQVKVELTTTGANDFCIKDDASDITVDVPVEFKKSVLNTYEVADEGAATLEGIIDNGAYSLTGGALSDADKAAIKTVAERFLTDEFKKIDAAAKFDNVFEPDSTTPITDTNFLTDKKVTVNYKLKSGMDAQYIVVDGNGDAVAGAGAGKIAVTVPLANAKAWTYKAPAASDGVTVTLYEDDGLTEVVNDTKFVGGEKYKIKVAPANAATAFKDAPTLSNVSGVTTVPALKLSSDKTFYETDFFTVSKATVDGDFTFKVNGAVTKFKALGTVAKTFVDGSANDKNGDVNVTVQRKTQTENGTSYNYTTLSETDKVFDGDILVITVEPIGYKFSTEDGEGLQYNVNGGTYATLKSGETEIKVTAQNVGSFALGVKGTLVADESNYTVRVPADGDNYTVKVLKQTTEIENESEHQAGTELAVVVTPIDGYMLDGATKFDGKVGSSDDHGGLTFDYKVTAPTTGKVIDLGKLLDAHPKQLIDPKLSIDEGTTVAIEGYTKTEYGNLSGAKKEAVLKTICDAVSLTDADGISLIDALDPDAYTISTTGVITTEGGKDFVTVNFELKEDQKLYALVVGYDDANKTVNVPVTFASTYDVSATIKGNAAATVTLSKESGKAGDEIKITVKPDITSLSIASVSITDISDVEFTYDKDVKGWVGTYQISADHDTDSNLAIELEIDIVLLKTEEFVQSDVELTMSADDVATLSFKKAGKYEITCDKETTTHVVGDFLDETIEFTAADAGKKLSIVKKGDGTTTGDSTTKVEVTVPSKGAAPSGLSYKATETDGETKGFTITGLNASTMEYKLEGDTEYTAVKSDRKLLPGTYAIRTKTVTTPGSLAFASDDVELVVSSETVTNLTAKVSALRDADATYNSSKATRTVEVVLSNSGANADVTCTLGELPEGWKLGTSLTNGKAKVVAGATKIIKFIVPAKDAGKYSGEVTFTDDADATKSVTAKVEFEIKQAEAKLNVTHTGPVTSDGGELIFTVTSNPVVKDLKTTLTVTPNAGVTISGNKVKFPANTTLKPIEYTVKATAQDKNYKFTCDGTKISIGPATKELDESRISIKESKNGSVGVDKAVAKKGEIVNIIVTPSEGYEIDTLTVTDAKGNELEVNKNRFIMPETDVTITATFKAEAGVAYKLEAAEAKNGAVSFTVGGAAATTAKAGDTVTVVTTPEDGYKAGTIAVKTASGKTVETTGNTFVMPVEDVTVTVTFVTEDTPVETEYAITAAAAENGTVSFEVEGAAAAAAKKGDVVTIVAEAADGYKVGTITVTGASGAVAVTDNTFEMPAEAVTVTVEFVEESAPVETAHAIDLAETTHGTFKAQVGGKDAKEAVKGDEVTIVTTPASGYRDGTISVKTKSGKTVTVRSKKFTMPDEDVTITVTFSRKSSGGSSGGSASRPSGGSSSGSSGSTSTTPSVSDSATVSTIKGTTSGGTAKLDGVVVMTTDAIKAAADNKVNLEVKVDDEYTWTIDADKLSDKNSVLRLSVSSATVNETETAKIKKSTGAEDRNEKAFSVVADNLGTGATLKVKTVAKSTDNAKKFANLYKTNADGTLTFVAAAPIDKDGNAVLPITDKGTYTIVASTETKMPGDINNDCKVDLTDLTAMLTSYVNNTNPKSFDNYKLDHDNSGELALSDLVAMLRDYSNGKL